MSAAAAAGEQAKALAAYAALSERLGEQLGTDPAPQTRELHLAILREQPVDPAGGGGRGPVVASPGAARAGPDGAGRAVAAVPGADGTAALGIGGTATGIPGLGRIAASGPALATGPAQADELAARTQTSPRYITEWLRGQAAGGYLIPSWIPALDGVQDKLRAGAKVADSGCGLGASTILLAQEYPNSHVTGSDYHDKSIELARKRAADAGVADRASFEVASAASFSGSGYDLAATFDCLHDMGDPLAAARHVRQALKPDGTWMVVEPYAADEPAGNMNPVGRVFYNASTVPCVPNALSQTGGYALGAQAGEAAIRQVVTDAGFTRFRRAAGTPFNLVYEVRP